MFNSSNF